MNKTFHLSYKLSYSGNFNPSPLGNCTKLIDNLPAVQEGTCIWLILNLLSFCFGHFVRKCKYRFPKLILSFPVLVQWCVLSPDVLITIILLSMKTRKQDWHRFTDFGQCVSSSRYTISYTSCISLSGLT